MLDYNPRLTIISNIQRSIDGKKDTKTYYKIEVSINDKGQPKVWTVEKTYEDFEQLYLLLKKSHPKTVPKFPTKSLISIKSNIVIMKRQEAFNNFLKECLVKNDIIEDFSFVKFIDIINQTKSFIKKLSFVDKFVSLTYNVKNLVPLRKNMFFAVLNNPHKSIKKKDIKDLGGNINNINSNLVSAPGKLLAFGLVRSWLKRYNSIDVVFNSCISAVNASENNIYVGLESGKVSIIKMTLEEGQPTMKTKEINVHNSKVIGIASNDKDSLFTLSKKTLKITSFLTNSIVNEKKFSFEASSYFYSKSDFIMYIGTSDGYIYAYSLLLNKFDLLSKLKLESRGKVKTMFVLNSIIYTGSPDGYIHEVHISLPTSKSNAIKNNSKEENNNEANDTKKEGLIENKKFYIFVYRFFKTPFNIKDVIYREDRKEIIIGDEKGVISFWNNYGEMIFSIKSSIKEVTKLIIVNDDLLASSKEGSITVWKMNDSLSSQGNLKTVEEFLKEDGMIENQEDILKYENNNNKLNNNNQTDKTLKLKQQDNPIIVSNTDIDSKIVQESKIVSNFDMIDFNHDNNNNNKNELKDEVISSSNNEEKENVSTKKYELDEIFDFFSNDTTNQKANKESLDSKQDKDEFIHHEEKGSNEIKDVEYDIFNFEKKAKPDEILNELFSDNCINFNP